MIKHRDLRTEVEAPYFAPSYVSLIEYTACGQSVLAICGHRNCFATEDEFGGRPPNSSTTRARNWASSTRTGEIREAELFVAALGVSGFTFAELTWTQQLPDWIGSHVRAFAFYNGLVEKSPAGDLAEGFFGYRSRPDLIGSSS
ncbi:hypothetical protein OKW40_001776 [Paraburkholderia sp. RAU6.4a]